MTSPRHATDAPTRRNHSSGPRHAVTIRRRRRVLYGVALAMVAVLAFGGTLSGMLYRQLQGRVATLEVDQLVDQPSDAPPPADPNAGTPLNILIIGSDSRADGAVHDEFTSVLADTHIIVHISADRSRVELISIPRDTMVDIPECTTTDGTTVYARYGMYNSAFAEAYVAGGDTASAVACDVNLAQSVTGLTMDGWVLVEMGGFVQMIDALGGVDICIPEAIDAPKANLVLPAGQQTLNGTQALGYVRARVGVGNGSDPGRIERQQHFMSAMVDEILSRNLLTDGPALYQMLGAALGSLTVSQNLSSLTDMAGLALSLRSVQRDDVTFLTTPFTEYAPDPNRLVFTDDVQDIWDALAADEPVVDPAAATPTDGAATDGAPSDAGPDAASSDAPTQDSTTAAPDSTTQAPGPSTEPSAGEPTPVC